MTRILTCGPYRFELSRPLLMGIINVTPDSFSGDGRLGQFEQAFAQGLRMVEEGADLLDVGGESSRPGAAQVAEDEELRRVLPLVERFAARGIAVSVDTVKPAVMRAALAAGAAMINDIHAFRAPGALDAVAASHCGLCVMHMQGTPQTMQQAPAYREVVDEVEHFLQSRVAALREAGVAAERIVIDPGLGFGKTLAHNLSLVAALPVLDAWAPVLLGVSRKSMLGELTGLPVAERCVPSVVAALAAARRGAALLRVHDVAATAAALKVWDALADDEKQLAP